MGIPEEKYNCLIDLSKLKNLYCGLGQFSLSLGKHLSEIHDDSVKFSFLVPENFRSDFEKTEKEILSLKRRYFPQICKKYELWHSVHQSSPYFPSNKKTLYILTIHDLNFLDEKSPAKVEHRKQNLQKRIDRATAITAISQFTANEVINHFDLKSKKIKVIYNGVDIIEFPNVKKPEFIGEGEYLFSIGVIKKKKNFKVLIGFLSKIPDIKLIIAGDKIDAYADEIAAEAKKMGVEKRIILPGTISDNDKFWLYKNCKAFVFPSLLEGFGLPVIEAMRFGKPVFLSKYSSLPEIGGKEAYYWDDFEPQNMAELFKIKMIEFQNDIDKEQRIIDHSKKFSWNNAAKGYVDIYRSVLKGLKPLEC